MRRMYTFCVCLAGLALATVAFQPAFAAKSQYKIVKKSKLKIDIYHPAKHIKAKSKKVRGVVSFEGSKHTFKLDGALTLKIKRLRSGNRSRDRKMWSALGKSVQKYIYFYPKSLQLKGDKGTITGDFLIRKIRKTLTFSVSKFKGTVGSTALSMTVKGVIKCTDFNVTRPSLLFVKIKDKVKLKFKLKLALKK